MDIASYISGFVDGEGCFCVSFQPSRRHRLGWEVRPSFSVSQNADRAELLARDSGKMGLRLHPTGSIRQDSEVRSSKRSGIWSKRCFLISGRTRWRRPSRPTVERFERICQLVHEGRHQIKEGLRRDRRVAMEMNPSGKRKYSGSEILNSLQSGERIVCATGNRGRNTKFRPARMA